MKHNPGYRMHQLNKTPLIPRQYQKNVFVFSEETKPRNSENEVIISMKMARSNFEMKSEDSEGKN